VGCSMDGIGGRIEGWGGLGWKVVHGVVQWLEMGRRGCAWER
jgi:hypothetical protein